MENIRIIKGDCITEMRNLEPQSIDMALIDPPYGVLKNTNPGAKWDKALSFSDLWGG